MKAPGDPRLPPGLRAHLLHPAPGDVPVVVDVVVVEDHRRRHGREQPADVGLRPRLAVEAGVLLEVGDLLARRLARVAAATDELERRRRDLVGVHLVAEQQEPVGPFGLAALEELRVRPERVDALLTSSRPVAGELRRLRAAEPARAEREPDVPLVVARVDDAGAAGRRRAARRARRRAGPRTASPRRARGRRRGARA